MTNAEKFKEVFGVYATETWAMSELGFLLWLNGEYSGEERKTGKRVVINAVLDKIRAEIQALRGCSCWCSDGVIDDVEDILDKYKAEREVDE